MTTAGRILKDGLEAIRKSADDMNVRLPDGVAKKIDNHVVTSRQGVHSLDEFNDAPNTPNAPSTPNNPGQNPPIDPSQNPPIDPSRNPDWLNDRLADTDLPFWRRRMAEGDQFNYQNHHRYPQNEVTLANGKRVDSYDPGEAIVSRKNTQLDDVRPETAINYINEVLNKYAPGTKINDTEVLDGTPILEVPVQNSPVSQTIIDHANSKDPRVVIRDVLGNVYN